MQKSFRNHIISFAIIVAMLATSFAVFGAFDQAYAIGRPAKPSLTAKWYKKNGTHYHKYTAKTAKVKGAKKYQFRFVQKDWGKKGKLSTKEKTLSGSSTSQVWHASSYDAHSCSVKVRCKGKKGGWSKWSPTKTIVFSD